MMPTSTLATENAVLLIIDPQEKLLPKVFEPERVAKNTILLLRFAKIVGLPVVTTTQYEKGIGPIVDSIRQELPEGPVFDKVTFGCFDDPLFRPRVEENGKTRKTLILTGIESHICVAQTALGALEHGFHVHVASDAVSSRTEWNWKTGLARMQQAGAIISSTEMVLFEIMKRSDAPAFKQILPDLKEPVV
jgi:nicotinamidase-related amidase